jgi:hypothetical protein
LSESAIKEEKTIYSNYFKIRISVSLEPMLLEMLHIVPPAKIYLFYGELQRIKKYLKGYNLQRSDGSQLNDVVVIP